MKKNWIQLLILTAIPLQLFFLFDYYFSFGANKIVVKGQRCTCPDAKVLQGKEYLNSITINSLKIYELNYTQMFFKNEISTTNDPMGVGEYVIFGKIVGKQKIAIQDKEFYPIFRIEKYFVSKNFTAIAWTLWILLILEILVLISLQKFK